MKSTPKTTKPATRKQTGSVEYRCGHWHAKVWLPDGTRKRIKLPEKVNSREKAKAMAEAIASKVESGRYAFPGEVSSQPITPKETFADYAQRWVEARRAKDLACSRDDFTRLRDHINPVLGHRPIVDITRDELLELVRQLDAKVDDPSQRFGWKTASHVWLTAKGVFKSACMSKDPAFVCRKDDPTDNVQGPDKGRQRERTYLYPSEFQALISCQAIPVKWRRMYALAVYTLSRAGELCALRWDAIDMDRGIINVRQSFDSKSNKVKPTKSGKARRVPIEKNLYPLLECIHRETGGEGNLVHVPPSKMPTRLREHLRIAGITRTELFPPPDGEDVASTWAPITFHDLRGTGVTWAALRGDEPLVIRQRAGHADFATTQRYLREAETLGKDSGVPFPPLPADILEVSQRSVPKSSSAIPSTWNQSTNLVRPAGLEPACLDKNSEFPEVFVGTVPDDHPHNSLKLGELSPLGHLPKESIRDRFMRHLSEVIADATRVGDIVLARVANHALGELLGEAESPALSLVKGGGQ